MSLRFDQLAAFAEKSTYNLSGVLTLMNHPRVQENMWRGVRLSSSGGRWNLAQFKKHSSSIYERHHLQTAHQRSELHRKWSRPLVGNVQLLDLLLMLHFTIDHTDTKLMYTSQLIHCLQVSDRPCPLVSAFTFSLLRSHISSYHFPL